MQYGFFLCPVCLGVPEGEALVQPAAWAGSRATIGNDQHQGDALEVDLEVAHPQTKEVNVEMTDGLEVEIEIEGEKGLEAGIKEGLGQGTGSV